LALQFLEREMDVKLVGIGAEDFVDSQTKLILGFLWSLFRKFKIATIKEQDKSSEEGLLLWVAKQTEGYPKVEVTNFKNTFKDGYAFLALIDKYKAHAVNYNHWVNNPDSLAQLQTAFKVAEETLGVPSLLDAQEVIDGTVDERGLVLYVSLYFHAFMALSERDKLESSKREITSKLDSVEERLKREQAEKEALEKERAELQRQQDELAALLSKKAHNYDELAQQNDALRKALDELNAKFDQQNGEMRNIKDELKMMQKEKSSLVDKESFVEEKTDVLKQLLEAEADLLKGGDSGRSKDNDLQARLKKTQETLDHEQKLHGVEDKILDELRARAAIEKTGLELLKKHLELHVDDLHRWQKYLTFDPESFADFEHDEAKLLASLEAKAAFADQVDFLTGKVHGENTAMAKMLKKPKETVEDGKDGKTKAKAKATATSTKKKVV